MGEVGYCPSPRELLKILQKLDAQFRGLCSNRSSNNFRSASSPLDPKRIVRLVRVFDCCSRLLIISSASASGTDQKALADFLPEFIQGLWLLLADSSLAASLANSQSLDKLACARTKLLQSVVHFFAQYYSSGTVSDEQRFKLIFNNLRNGEFIVRLDADGLNLAEELDKLVLKRACTEQQKLIAQRALDSAYEQKRKAVKETLAAQGMLQFIGFPRDNSIADQVQQLTEIMPDLSRPQLHLCLRHFGYDLEQTLAALCEREQLPLNLRILLRTKDTMEDVKGDDGKRPFCAAFSDKQIMDEEEQILDRRSAIVDVGELEEMIEQLDMEEPDTVEVGGKLLVKQEFKRDRAPNSAERSGLIAASMRMAKEEEEQEEGKGSESGTDNEAEEEDYESIRRAQEEDHKLATEVGQSGRFNRQQKPQPKFMRRAIDELYEDEYDDSHEHALLDTGIDMAAASFDEKELPPATRSTAGSRIGKGGGKQEQPPSGRPTTSAPNKQKGPTAGGGKPAEAGKSGATAGKKPATAGEGYTGGRERQLKERHKGKQRQQGADKKARARGPMF